MMCDSVGVQGIREGCPEKVTPKGCSQAATVRLREAGSPLLSSLWAPTWIGT